jgi:hypothetical protein
MITLVPLHAPTVSASDAEQQTNIYFFWGDGCPHCANAKPFLENLDEQSDAITLYSYEVYNSSWNQMLFQKVGEELQLSSSGVPLIIIGDEPFVGYSQSYADTIEARAVECSEDGCPDSIASIVGASAKAEPADDTPAKTDQQQSTDTAKTINLPILGTVNVRDFSLPILTIIIAAIDGFNPCAMWVLLFLITVLLGMKDRRRMWALGGAFIAASSFVYFLFLAAWLNIFAFIGYISWVKSLIGVAAIAIGIYYLRDYFANKNAVCKVTNNTQRQKILTRIRDLTHERNFWIALVGIVVLAFAVNLIELVCSAGLPAVFSGVLATSGIPTWQQYMYMLLYVLVFMADDLLIFFTAMFTMKITGLQANYARASHLVGGIVMLLLGGLLLFAPQLLMFG